MHIAIFGGSFNPIHRGHTELANWMLQQDLVDQLWLLVSPLNPLKQSCSELLPDEERLRLARLAVNEASHSNQMLVSDFEMTLPRPSYTVHTLRCLRQTYPKFRFSLLIGADNWLAFPRWASPEEIMAHHDIFVYPRPGCDVALAEQVPPHVHYLADAPLCNISSTQLRNAISHPTSELNPADYLAPSVWNEIRRRGFWKT